MLTGNDFAILTSAELELIYRTLAKQKDKATYKELSDMGILGLVQEIEKFLYLEG